MFLLSPKSVGFSWLTVDMCALAIYCCLLSQCKALGLILGTTERTRRKKGMEELPPINSFLFNQPSSSYSLVFKGHCKSFRSLETDFGYYVIQWGSPPPHTHTHTDIFTKSILHSLISSFPLFSSGQFLLLLLYHLFIEIALIHK